MVLRLQGCSWYPNRFRVKIKDGTVAVSTELCGTTFCFDRTIYRTAKINEWAQLGYLSPFG